MNIIIGADFVPTERNKDSFSKGEMDCLIEEDLLEIISGADYSIFNLEMPLSNTSCPIEKCGANLIAPESTVNGYTSLGVSMVTLANNHIMDQDVQGLANTIMTLENNGIEHIGAGGSIKEASKSIITSIDGKKIGIYACVEHEFSIATDDTAGANPFDPLESYDHIMELKTRCDYIIVLYHGGKEHYRYPSPNLQKVCRKFIDKGANLVVCQHSHCIGCEEKFKNGTIVYGQGNFLFDYCDDELWQSGVLIQITDDFEIRYIPLQSEQSMIKIATDNNIMDQFYHRSNQIKNNNFVNEQYRKFASLNIEYYFSILDCINQGVMFRVLNKITGKRYMKWLLSKYYKQRNRLIIQNCIECEAHRELLIEGIKEYDSKA